MPNSLPLDEQLTALEAILRRNPVIPELLSRLETLDLPGWYLTAGCLVQTVWNVVTDRPVDTGIKDYDVFYFDDSDLSYDAEDAVIQRGRELFADLDVEVEIRNEARVHLWYEAKFGVPMAPYTSTEAAIDSFAATTCSIGIRASNGRWSVYAPYGLSDTFNLLLRPNPIQAPRRPYLEKSARWKEIWPELTILPWPGESD
ncbi:hypothetical protein FB566_1785 [Stackebrandtia endophytica]|uniref:Nucleotidyltransferase family protein n=1 Tax=Stackebrandtia endophytica TaxID=1496996 RepID=A0A543AUP6_9ACTN|nr:nucleotidyltransferase family protein [Stackebrandtia endophytica]TQL76261.1 hypothetical protein FB566_1785 [Stackebrandtia endophytica]